MVASNGIICPVDGTQLILVSSTNIAGDPIYRWECPIDDWAGPWYSKNEPLPELLRSVRFIGNAMPLAISEPAILQVNIINDYDSLEVINQEIDPEIDTTITFSQSVRALRISNWNVSSRILVKDGPISSSTDVTAARIGRAYKSNVPRQVWFPFVTNSVHLLSRFDSIVTIEGYFGNA